ncbi:MAG TPA: hypothetical protein VKO18_17715 [Terriglobia bacterium]|nr:hypothetical protein [Terriglobia bacterium]
MSLVKKPEMTEENLAAHRANGAHSHGAVTPEGKARVAAANLRHGFYAKAQNGALAALGEDPEEYANLMNSLANNLIEGLEGELRERIGDTLWRMKRAARMRNGLALKRIKAVQELQQTRTMPQRLQAHESLQCYEDFATALRRRGNGPTPAEINTFMKYFADDRTERMQEFFLLLKSLNKLEEGPERKAALRKARAQLKEMEESHRRVCIRISDQIEEMESPENLAALTAPRDEQALLMQRLEDSSLRQLWRLTNMLLRVRNGAPTPSGSLLRKWFCRGHLIP